jgi:hypothetical protein
MKILFLFLIILSIIAVSHEDTLPKTLNELLNSRMRITTTNEPVEYIDETEDEDTNSNFKPTLPSIKSLTTLINGPKSAISILERNLQKMINLEYHLDNMIFKMSMDFRYRNKLEFNENDLKTAECLTNRNSLIIKMKNDWALTFNITMINSQTNNLTSKKLFKLNQVQFNIDKGTKEYESNVEDHRLDDQTYQRCFFN